MHSVLSSALSAYNSQLSAVHHLALSAHCTAPPPPVAYKCSAHGTSTYTAAGRSGARIAYLPHFGIKVAASITNGCSLHHTRLRPPSHTVAASITYGYVLHHIRLRPPIHTVTASITYGDSLQHIRLQPPTHTVTAPPEVPASWQRVPARRCAAGPVGMQR